MEKINEIGENVQICIKTVSIPEHNIEIRKLKILTKSYFKSL